MQCQELLDVEESSFIQEALDWRSIFKFLVAHHVASNSCDVMNSREVSEILCRGGFNQALLRCLVGKVTKVFKEVYAGLCGEYQGGFSIFKKLIHLGYY